jgi:hypothetical protein
MRHRKTFRCAGGALFASLLAASAAAQGSLATNDGLSLSLSPTGAVSSLKLAGVEYAAAALPSGFAYREMPPAPQDVAPNGSLESGTGTPDGWTWTNNGNGTWAWDSSVAAVGARSLRVDVPGTTDKRSPMLTSAPMPIRANTPYTFSCRVRTRDLSSVLNIFLVETDSAGNLLQRGVTSDSGTIDWELRRLTFVSSPIAVSAYFKVEIFSGHGTAWVDDIRMLDVFAGRAPAPLPASVTSDAGAIAVTAASDGLVLDARLSSVGSAIRVDATLSDTTGADRALELSFALPLDVPGWTWDQGPISSSPIASGVRYEHLDTSFGAQTHSVYPFATVRSTTAAVTLATPMVPQMSRSSYNRGNGLRLVWDLGLSPAAATTPSRASVSFWIYTQDPRWGFRSAAEKYRTLNPAAFVSPVAAGAGAWVIPLTGESVTSVAGFQDFGWSFLEGVGDIDFGNANGLAVMHYVDAAGYFRLFPGVTIQPPYETLVAALESDAAQGCDELTDGIPCSEMAQATINSSPHDPNGRYQVDADSYFWYRNRLQIYPVSPDADIPAPSMWSIATKYRVDGRLAWAADEGVRLDGIFLDDVTTTFAAVENYRRELWAYSDVPLTFSWDTGRVMLLTGFSMAEFCGSFRSYVNDRNLILMGSMNPGVYSWFAPSFDVLGGESDGAEAIDRAYVRRVLGDGRPWSNLFVPPDRSVPTAGEVLAYLRQALLLGYFPGFNGIYWSNPSAYERDRSLFRKYIPLIRTVARAGWRPVTGATAPNPAILIERFDGGRGGIFYLTAQNSGASAATPAITLDASTLAIGDGPIDVHELVRDRAVPVTRVTGGALFTDTIAPGETLLYRVQATLQDPERGTTRQVGSRN